MMPRLRRLAAQIFGKKIGDAVFDDGHGGMDLTIIFHWGGKENIAVKIFKDMGHKNLAAKTGLDGFPKNLSAADNKHFADPAVGLHHLGGCQGLLKCRRLNHPRRKSQIIPT